MEDTVSSGKYAKYRYSGTKYNISKSKKIAIDIKKKVTFIK